MYRVSKVLNNNGVIAINMEENIEYVLLGKGIGFGKKISQRFEAPDNCTRYSLKEDTERGSGEQISNPLTEDIRVLFHSEYEVASQLKEILQKRLGIEIDAHEIGYVALHIHSAIEDESVSAAMQMAGAIRECVQVLERESGKKIDVMSLAYNRLMNHVKYMVMRAVRGESIKLDMNEYMEEKHPESFALAAAICEKIERGCKIRLEKMEVGYLAMHIERVYLDTLGAQNEE